MIPVKLTISGFLSYKEPAEVDFTGLHVACITGRNGAGKSTMLDAITWALFGEARRNDDSIINHQAADNTAKVDFEFLYENSFYRAVRTKKAGKPTTADLFIRSEDGKDWKAISEKKVIETNKQICKILHMDYRTFINASFFLQGKADQFTGQNATERKKILSTILNLDIWEVYKTRTTELRKETESSLRQLSSLIRENENEIKEGPVLKQRQAAIEEKIKTAKRDSENADKQWELAKTAEAALQTLKNTLDQKQQDEIRQTRQIRVYRESLEAREKELAGLRARLADADTIEQNYKSLQENRSRLEKLQEDSIRFHRLQTQRSGAENRIQSTEKQLRFEYSQLRKEKAELDSELPEQQRLSDDIKRKQPELEKLTADLSRREALQQRLDSLKEQGARLKSAGDVLVSRVREIEQKIQKLRLNQGAVCPTCGREMDAEHCKKHEAELRDEIAGLQSGIQANEAERVPLRDECKDLLKEIKRLDDLQPRLSDLKVYLGTAEHRLQLYNTREENWKKEKSARFAEAEQLLRDGSFCPEERRILSDTAVQLAELGYDQKEHEQVQACVKQLSGAEQAHQELLRSQSRIAPLEREISEKSRQVTEETERLKQLREDREKIEKDYLAQKEQLPDIPALEAARNSALRNLQQLHREQGEILQQVRHLEDAQANLQRYGTEFKEKTALAERYKTLEKAFGKDGIPALLIEQAVPEIEEQANNILDQLSNGTMSLQMTTQGTYKSKKDEVKETLDIMISDQFGTREYEMFSGGEAFRINFSIRLALSRILAQRAGSRLQTLVIDEGFGSQDDEGRARLADAITKVQNDFEKILVITHLSELKEAFPSRIEVEKTGEGSRVEVIP